MAETPEAPTPTSICNVPTRGRAACTGVIASATIPPPGDSPAFTVIVTDVDREFSIRGGTPIGKHLNHRIRLVWLGRRRVPGIMAGTALRFEGMVSLRDGLPTIYNPRYEIISKEEQ
ncbi:MAG: OB-fold nucleic acid binding domain-containing protein [Acidobacteria bacterium]|nr:OB-fold nucleic acid binding domain-containing protein [Acidobacteriota bacterium]